MKTITIEKGNDYWKVFKEYYWMPTTYSNDMPAAEVVEKLKALHPDTDILVSAWLNSGGDDMGNIGHLYKIEYHHEVGPFGEAIKEKLSINDIIVGTGPGCLDLKQELEESEEKTKAVYESFVNMYDISHLIPLTADPEHEKKQEENINKLIRKGRIACI